MICGSFPVIMFLGSFTATAVLRGASDARLDFAPVWQRVALGLFVGWLPALIPLLSAAVFRGGLGLRGFGIAVATGAGVEASRLRALGRALLAWAPMAISLGVVRATAGRVETWVTAFSLGLFVVGAIWAVLHPTRGLQDRIAGTYLVPR